MNRHYKRIYCCGDCVYYDWKKHKCKRGAHVTENAQDHFFADCPLDDFIEEDRSKAEGEDKRTDAEIEKAISFFRDMNECTYGNLEEVEMAIKALEQKSCIEKTTEQASKEFEEKLNSGYYRSQREEARQIEEEGINHEKPL